MDVIWPLLVCGLAVLGAGVAPRVLGRRRHAALRRGCDVSFRVRLAGAVAPYPQTPRRGVLRVGPDRLTWTGRGGGAVLDLSAAGLRPTGLREPRSGDGGGPGDAVLTAADSRGSAVRLVGLVGTVDSLYEVLSERPPPAQSGPPIVIEDGQRQIPAWALPMVVLLLVLGGGALTTAALATGVRVTGTVISEPDADDYCDVRWTDPRDGSVQINGIDCYDSVGDRVPLLALAGPLRGEVVASDDPWFWAAMSAALAVVAVVWGVRRVRADGRDRTAPAFSGVAVAPPPVLDEHQLDYGTVVSAMRARAAADGWSFEPDPDAEPQSWVFRSPRRLAMTVIAASVWPLAIGGFFAAVIGWTSVAGLWGSLGETARVTATVTGEPYETIPFAPEDLEVEFPVGGGRRETTLVAVRGLPDTLPGTIEVEYSLANPDRARALQHDGAALGAGLSAAAVLLGTGVSGWRLWHLAAGRRDERRALRHGKQLLRYVLVPDFDGTSVLLLYRDGLVGQPTFALALLADLQGHVAAAGTVEVHGRLAAGEVVVAKIAGIELPTASTLLEIDSADARDLVNATEPAEI